MARTSRANKDTPALVEDGEAVETNTTETQQQPEATDAAPIEKRTFDFEIEEGLEIPTAPPRAPVAHELPFRRKFDQMTKHGMSFWLPTSFWTLPQEAGGRGVDPEKATSTYVRNKVRTAFNQWKKADEEARENRDILMVPREKGDNNGKGGVFEEPGFTVFMIVKQ